MSTRSITVVRSRWDDKEWKNNAVIYRHHDGYLEGHGDWLYHFLDGLEVINGIPSNPPPRFANGPGRLAAMMVTELQRDGHDPSLDTDDGPCGQEFHYQVDVQYGFNGGSISVTVFDGPMTLFGEGGEQCTRKIFEGTVEEFSTFINSQQEQNQE